MSPEPPRSEAAVWRQALRAADAAAHEAELERVRTTAVDQLESRLVRANADRLALREAVTVRDAMLRRFLAQEGQFLRRARRRVGRLLQKKRR